MSFRYDYFVTTISRDYWGTFEKNSRLTRVHVFGETTKRICARLGSNFPRGGANRTHFERRSKGRANANAADRRQLSPIEIFPGT